MNLSTRTKYIPPTRSSFPTSAKKTAPKKEFSLSAQAAAFPCLVSPPKTGPSLLSFANMVKTNIPACVPVLSDVSPGWVHIRKQGGHIQYKSGKPSNRYPLSDENFILKFDRWVWKSRLAKDQYERDSDVIRLGDLSEYYGAPTLLEMYAAEEEEEEDQRLQATYDLSTDMSDSDDYNKFEIPYQ
jgi:hypothetical protein